MSKLKFNFEGFRMIAQSTQDDLLEYFGPKILEKYGKDNVDITKDYIFARGSLPVMLVAHLDTVHKTKPTDLYYDEKIGVMWSPQGIGGDDRCGIYGIVTLLNYLSKNGGKLPSVLFTTFEETGCVGAGIASRKIADHFISHLNYVIELDRRGRNDCVFYQCGNVEFKKMIETYGFVTAIGSASDISKICPEWDIAGVNLSIGYDNEHSDREVVYVNWLMATLERVITMVTESPDKKRYEFKLPYNAWDELRKVTSTKKGGAKRFKFSEVEWKYDVKSKESKCVNRATGVALTDVEQAMLIYDDYGEEDYPAAPTNYNLRGKKNRM
jgi:hypothetical protein